MKLLYVYISQYGAFNKSGFNLNSDYVFAFDEGTKVLRYKYKPILPKRFYDVMQGKRQCCVEAISALIGKNGAGKTTIARYLCDCLSEASNIKGCFWVVESKGRLQLRGDSDIISGVSVDQDSVDCSGLIWEERDTFDGSTSGVLPFGVVYYSPMYTCQHVIEQDAGMVWDISTTGLLQGQRALPAVEDIDFDLKQVSDFKLYEMDECKKSIEFLASESVSIANKDLDFPIRFPHGILLKNNADVATRILEKFKKKYDEIAKEYDPRKQALTRLRTSADEVVNQTAQSIKRILDAVEGWSQWDLASKVFVTFALTWWWYEKWDENREGYANVGLRLIETVERMGRCSRDSRSRQLVILNFCDAEEVYAVENRSKYFCRLIRTLTELCQKKRKSGMVITDDQITLSLNDGRKAAILQSLTVLHGASRVFQDYLLFEYAPKISSGEMAFISLMGRLKSVLDGIALSGLARPLLIFLDEAETALHPEWQRQLVWLLVWYLQQNYSSMRFQIVFASHSPILLSDIPEGNVVFLKENCEPEEREGKNLNQRRFGFGANIYDLYRHSFFLKDGTVGRFARGKIDDVVRKVYAALAPMSARTGEADSPFDDEGEKICRLVTDPLVSRYFKSMHQLIEERMKCDN